VSDAFKTTAGGGFHEPARSALQEGVVRRQTHDLRRVASLIAELFELDDRTRFEVLEVSLGMDRSDVRARLVKSFDQFHDVRLKTDLLNVLQVDIAVAPLVPISTCNAPAVASQALRSGRPVAPLLRSGRELHP
jgi:hypothetical protein